MSKPSKGSHGKLTVVGGSKGGVGKSFVTMAALDYLTNKGESPLLIETDTSNPDVAKAYGKVVACETINLDEKDGWLQLLDVCGSNVGKHVVVNSAARSNTGVKAYGELLSDNMEEIQRELTTLWVINRHRDSLELLKAYRAALPNTTVHVVRNAYHGDESKFELYNSSNIREAVESSGGKSVTFPDMAARVADDIYGKRMTIEEATASMSIGNRAELKRWRKLMFAMMDEVLGG